MWICDDLEDRLVAAAVRFLLFWLVFFYVTTSPRWRCVELDSCTNFVFAPCAHLAAPPVRLHELFTLTLLPIILPCFNDTTWTAAWCLLVHEWYYFFVLKNYYYVACFYSRPRASIYKHCTLKLHTNKAKWERTYLSLSTICVVTDCFSFFFC